MECCYGPGDIVLENWTLGKKIGSGRYSNVFEAESREPDGIHRAAIKIISIRDSADGNGRDRISSGKGNPERRDLMETVGALDQKVLTMLQFRESSHLLHYVAHDIVAHSDGKGWDVIIRMEPAASLLSQLLKHGLTRNEVIRIGIGICRALEDCRRNGVSHQNVTLENLFVSENGEYKLGGMDAAHMAELQRDAAEALKAQDYLAPELRGAGAEEDASGQGDVYALGLVLHRLLNHNRMPYLPPYPQAVTEKELEAANGIRFKGVPVPAPFNGDEELNAVILKACEFDPARRYDTPTQMREALEPLLGGLPDARVAGAEMFREQSVIKTVQEQPSPEPKKSGSLKLWGAILGAAALILAVLFSGWGREPNITVELPELAVMAVGQNAQLRYTASQTPEADQLHWASADEGILTVNRGVLTGMQPGETSVTLRCGENEAVCRVIVLEQAVAEGIVELEDREWYCQSEAGDALIRVDDRYYWYDAGRIISEEAVTLLHTAALQNLETVSVEWSAGWMNCYQDPEKQSYCGSVVLAVDPDGMEMVVIHTAEDTWAVGLDQIEQVQPEPYTALRMEPEMVSLHPGETAALAVYAVGADGTVTLAAGMTWSVDQEAVVQVSQGMLTAIGQGSATVTATDGTYSCSCVVTVEELPEETTAPAKPDKEQSQNNKPQKEPTPTKPAPTKPPATQPPATQPPATQPPATQPPATQPPATQPPATQPPATQPPETQPPATQPPATQPPETQPPETQPPETEPSGKAPGGYSIRLSPSTVYVGIPFYVTVTPDVADYTKIVIHAIDPTGGRWDFVISSGNSYDLMVTQPELVGKWTLYADVYNEYGVFYGASSGARATLTVLPLF